MLWAPGNIQAIILQKGIPVTFQRITDASKTSCGVSGLHPTL